MCPIKAQTVERLSQLVVGDIISHIKWLFTVSLEIKLEPSAAKTLWLNKLFLHREMVFGKILGICVILCVLKCANVFAEAVEEGKDL